MQRQQEQPPSRDLTRQVFISHTSRDEAAKVFAADVLKPALESAGLKVFIDHKSLQLGNPWPEDLVEAACLSAVMVVVLSTSYTNRFWCMLELDLALNGSSHHPSFCRTSNPLIIPVFYDDPDSIVKVSAIKQHWTDRLSATEQQQQRQQQQQPWLQQWVQQDCPVLHWFKRMRYTNQDQPQPQQAAKHLTPAQQPWVQPDRWAQNISAMENNVHNIRRSSISEAVKDRNWQLAICVVQRAVPHVFKPIYTEEDLVGYDQQLNDLLYKLLAPHHKADMLGVWIHGLGGVGKTTLARLLFNQLAPKFTSRAFVSLNPEDGSQQIKEHLVGALAALGTSIECKRLDVGQLLTEFQDAVRNKPVLLVVDNVWTAEQLDGTLPRQLHRGSTLIITSRRDALRNSKRYQEIAGKLLHHPAFLLDDDAARQLFRTRTQFPSPLPDNLTQLEEKIVNACGGLPLALGLAGGALANRTDPNEWEEVLAALLAGGQLPNADENDKLMSILVTSLRSLTEAPQNIFLDAVSIFHGADLPLAKTVWQRWWPHQALGALRELESRALIQTSMRKPYVGADVEGLEMHDIIRAFGRGILKGTVPFEPAGPTSTFAGSRVWVDDDGALVNLVKQTQQQTQPAALVAVSLGHWDPLHAYGIKMSRANSGMHNSEWEAVMARRLELLRVLLAPHLTQSQQRELWKKLPKWQPLPLLVLDLTHCEQLTELPESIGNMTLLQILRLSNCTQLRVLPECIGQLTALQELDLRWCKQLTALPESIWKLTALQVLNLGECSQFRILPATIGQLTALQRLTISSWYHLRTLPDSIGQLKALQTLDVSWCSELRTLPESLVLLTTLQLLDLSLCKQLSHLPASIGQLKMLRKLELRGCDNLSTWPESFGQLTALQELEIYCEKLSTLPDSFGQLRALHTLKLRQLSTLPESVSQLTALQWLDLYGCEFGTLPESLGQLRALQQLRLTGCAQLSKLPESIGNLAAMQGLDINSCQQLRNLPESLGQLATLQWLGFCSCYQLRCLPDSVGQLKQLQELDLMGCRQLSCLPDSIGQLTALERLILGQCEQLRCLPDSVGQLKQLQELDLMGCQQLSCLPDTIGQLTALERLLLGQCKQLSALPESIARLTALQELDVSCCQLNALPNSIGQLVMLQELRLSGCTQLRNLQESIAQITSLQKLDLSYCKQLTSLPASIGRLTQLQELELSSCEQLSILPETIVELTALQVLGLEECKQLNALPELIGQLTALRVLKIWNCQKLSTLPASFRQLTALEDLDIDGCEQLVIRQSALPESIAAWWAASDGGTSNSDDDNREGSTKED